jgi:hypothetical protein
MYGALGTAETDVLKQAQHFVVCRVVWDEESHVGISQHSGDSDETSSSARDHTHVLPRVLAVFALPIVVIVEVRDSFP